MRCRNRTSRWLQGRQPYGISVRRSAVLRVQGMLMLGHAVLEGVPRRAVHGAQEATEALTDGCQLSAGLVGVEQPREQRRPRATARAETSPAEPDTLSGHAYEPAAASVSRFVCTSVRSSSGGSMRRSSDGSRRLTLAPATASRRSSPSWAERRDCACMPSTAPTPRSAGSSSGTTSASPDAAEAARRTVDPRAPTLKPQLAGWLMLHSAHCR